MSPTLAEACQCSDHTRRRMLDEADARARTAGRVYSVRRHRKAAMLELAVGWADR